MLIGDPKALAFDLDWVEIEPRASFLAGEAATWSQLRIIVGGQLVTENVDPADKFGEGVFGSPLPLCTWALSNWDELFANERRPTSERVVDPFSYLEKAYANLESLTDPDDEAEALRQWWASHSIRGSRDGYALPELMFWRQGSWMTLWWRADQTPFGGANLRFLTPTAQAKVPTATVASAFLELFEVVEEKINSQGVHCDDDWRVDDLFRLHRSVRSEKARLHFLIKESGLTPIQFAEVTGVDAGILQAVEDDVPIAPQIWRSIKYSFDLETPQEVPKLQEIAAGSAVLALFRSAAPSLTNLDIHELKALLRTAGTRTGDAVELEYLREEARDAVNIERLAPYRIGQLRARLVRDLLEIGPGDPLDIEQWILRLTMGPVLETSLSDFSIDAVSLWSKRLGPVVAVNVTSRMGGTMWGRRMALAHELCHLLFDTSFGQPLGIASGRFAARLLEQTADAFAAELLLPRTALARYEHESVTERELIGLMERYQVGVTVATYQLQNHGFLSPYEAHDLRAQFSGSGHAE